MVFHRRTITECLRLGCILKGLMLLSAPVLAQQTESLVLEEIIITAQKKSESLQDAPISITAFGSEELETRGIASIGDLEVSVPSMSIERFPLNANTLRIYIRGVGSPGAQITQDSPVSVYQDGIHFARPNGLGLDVADIERIEVLKGPQGTLYGRNSTGGAISIITRRPNPEAFEFKQKFSLGSRSLFSSKTTLNIPVADNFAVKMNYYHNEQDGFIENAGPGGDFGDNSSDSLVLSGLWQPIEAVSFYYAYDRSKNETYPYTAQAVLQPSANGTQADQINDNSIQFTPYSERRLDTLRTFAPLKPNVTEVAGHSFIANFQINDNNSLRYLFSHREIEEETYTELSSGGGFEFYRGDTGAFTSRDGTVDLPSGGALLEQRQLSHELIWLGGFNAIKLDYTAGIFYIEEDSDENDAPRHSFSALLDSFPNDTLLTSVLERELSAESKALAAYIQLDWTPNILNERLAFTFGYRHSRDERSAFKQQLTTNYIQEVTTNIPTPISVLASSEFPATHASNKFTDDSFSLIANFAVNDNINSYIKLIEAYRTGFFNTRDPDQERFARGVDSEKVRSLELGFKSELLERRLRLNVNAFYSRYKDMQISFLIPGSISDTFFRNAGTADLGGVEIDINYLASKKLLLTLNYGLLDTEVTKAIDADGEDVTDDLVFFSAPHQTYTASATYTLVENDSGRLSLHGSYSFMDERAGSGSAANSQTTYIDDFGLWNARLSYNDVPMFGGSMRFALYGSNLADKEYVGLAINNLPNADRSVFWGEPRTIGVDLAFEF